MTQAPDAGILNRILQQKRAELPELRARRLPPAPGPRPFSLRREDGAVRLICEIKFRSPSAGPLSTELSAGRARKGLRARRREYGQRACAIRELLRRHRLQHLVEARAACDLPLLCKEFVIDECQLDAALRLRRGCGAAHRALSDARSSCRGWSAAARERRPRAVRGGGERATNRGARSTRARH